VRFGRKDARTTSLNLSADVFEKLRDQAYERRVSMSAIADEILRDALAVEKEGAADDEWTEPKINDKMPMTKDEIFDAMGIASFDLHQYFQFAERIAPIDSVQCDKIIHLIALASASMVANGRSSVMFVEQSIANLRKLGPFSIPIVRRAVEKRFSEIMNIRDKENDK